MGLYIIGAVLVLFFYLMKSDFSGYPDSYEDYRKNLESEDY